jgi:hypothetical protein
VVFCKTCEDIRELKCVVFLLLCVVNLKDGVMSTGFCNLFRLKNLCYKM